MAYATRADLERRFTAAEIAELTAPAPPPADAFTVKVDGATAALDPALPPAVAGRTVTLTLAAPVAADDAVTVRYDRPASGPVLQDTDDPPNAVVSFGDLPVAVVTGDAPAAASGPTVTGTALVIPFSEPLGGPDRTETALADAAAEIDGALAARFTLPLGAGPWPELTAIACDLARAGLYDDAIPKRVANRARDARRRLRELASGDRRLVDAAGAAETDDADLPAVAGPDPALTRRQLDAW